MYRKFEYQELLQKPEIGDQTFNGVTFLNTLGADGWELCDKASWEEAAGQIMSGDHRGVQLSRTVYWFLLKREILPNVPEDGSS